MKPAVEVYTTKFSQFVFTRNLGKLMSIEKIYCNESQKSLSQQHFNKTPDSKPLFFKTQLGGWG